MGCDASKGKMQELERIKEEIRASRAVEQKLEEEIGHCASEIKLKQESQVKASAKIAQLELKMTQLEGFIGEGQDGE